MFGTTITIMKNFTKYSGGNRSGMLKVLLVVVGMVWGEESWGATYYSQSSTANTNANTLANWNTVRGGGGSSPGSFTVAGDFFVIQSGHKYQVTAAWAGTATSVIQIESGGALDVNAKTLNTWSRIDLAGTGVSSSGALLNSSGSAAASSIPITLTAATAIMSSGSGGLTLTGNIINGGFLLAVDGANATAITTGVISGTGGLTKAGAGTLTLSGTNTYTGITTVSVGTLKLGIRLWDVIIYID